MQHPQNDDSETAAAIDAAPLAMDGPTPALDPAPTSQDAPSKLKKKKKKHKLGLKIEHQTAGRVRMKVAAAKGDPALLEEIGKTFGVIPGIERVTVNPTTGSLVLHYDHARHDDFHRHLHSHCQEHHCCEPPPKTEYDEIASKIEQEAEFLAEHSHAARVIVHVCKRLDHEIKAKTNNTFDLKIGLAGGVIALTLLELGASAATPVWLTLGVFTLNHFVELQKHHSLEQHQHELEDKVNKRAPVVVKGDEAPPAA